MVTQAKTSLPVYKVSLAKKYTNNQKGKQMEASVKIPKVKITGTDGKVMKSESEKLNDPVFLRGAWLGNGRTAEPAGRCQERSNQRF